MVSQSLLLEEWSALGVLVLSAGGAFLLWAEREQAKKAQVLKQADVELEGGRLLDEGWKALRDGNPAVASQLLHRVLRLGNRQSGSELMAYTRYRLSLLSMLDGEIERAIRTLRPAVDKRSRLVSAHLYLARLYEKAGQLEKAVAVLRTAYRPCRRLPEVRAWVRQLQDTDAQGTSAREGLTIPWDQLAWLDSRAVERFTRLGLDRLPVLAHVRAIDLVGIVSIDEGTALKLIEEAKRRFKERKKNRKV